MSTDATLGRMVSVRVFATKTGSSEGIADIIYDQGYTEFPSVQSDGTPGYRIRGKVQLQYQTINFAMNPINLAIYNLGSHSRQIVESKIGTKIAIFAGYAGVVKQIAQGNILWAATHKEGGDYITNLIAGDSHFAKVNGTVNQSFKGLVPYQQVVETLIGSLVSVGMTRGTVIVPIGFLNNGIVLAKNPLDELKDFCKKIGADMYIQNGTVNVIPSGFPKPSPVITIDTGYDKSSPATGQGENNTGVVGIPEIQAPGLILNASDTQTAAIQLNMTFKHLLRTDIGPGQLINMRSRFINNRFVVAHVNYDFDSWEGPFYSEYQCFIAGNASG